MKRLTALVSGNVQKVGYRARVAQTANALGLKGFVENLADGKVRIIAEGEEERLRWFEEAINIKNTLIQVSSIERTYSDATGELSRFYKAVDAGETDSRLDQGIELLKEIIITISEGNRDLHSAISEGNHDLGGTIKEGNRDLRSAISEGNRNLCDAINEMNHDLGNAISEGNRDLGGKMDTMIETQRDTLNEVRDARRDLRDYMDQRFEKIEIELSEMKAILKSKGLI
ncbi:MAG: Acylphosphatase [Methanosaeta sp. PtaU1.Bin060]|jgi:acylphosphatase|nr:MAG: Acylphosphatase [Methanosaeta sp. PtaU1.Bin060]